MNIDLMIGGRMNIDLMGEWVGMEGKNEYKFNGGKKININIMVGKRNICNIDLMAGGYEYRFNDLWGEE